MSTKLSDLSLGTCPDYVYGIEGASGDFKYHPIEFVNVKNLGAVGDGTTDDTVAIQKAISAAFGVAVFKGDTGGSASTTLNVTQMICGKINDGTYMSQDGSRINKPTVSGGGGGIGTYTMSVSQTIASNTILSVSNGQSNPFKNKILYFPAGIYRITSPLYMLDCLGGRILGASNGGSVIKGDFTGAEGFVLTNSSVPTFTPIWVCDGWAYGTMENLRMVGTVTSLMVQKFANGTTTANTSPIHVPDTTGIVANMGVYSVNRPQSARGAVVTSTTSNTVSIDYQGDTVGQNIVSGDSLLFVSSTMGIYLGQSGWYNITSAIDFRNCGFDNFGTGVAGGYGSGGNCENMMFTNCNFSRCALAGTFALNANVLNWGIIGGSFTNCGTASTYDPVFIQDTGNSGAAIRNGGGSVSHISNVTFSGNTWDIVHESATSCSVIAGTSYGGGVAPLFCDFTGFVDNGSGGAGNILHVTAVANGTLRAGGILNGNSGLNSSHYIKGATTTAGGDVATYIIAGDAVLTTSGSMRQYGRWVNQSIAAVGCPVDVRGVSFFGATVGDAQESFHYLDSIGGTLCVSSCVFSPTTDPVTKGYFVTLNNGTLKMDACKFSGHSEQAAMLGHATYDRVYISGSQWLTAKHSAFFTGFSSGQIMHYDDAYDLTHDLAGKVEWIVANLPAAHARWKSCDPIYVTDSNLAWASNVGTDISTHGGGTHYVPVRCPEGTAWVIV